jgi:putative transposase
MQLFVSDKCLGLAENLAEFYPEAKWQRCVVQALLVHIRAVHTETRDAYGWPRLWRELRQRGVRVGKQRLQLLMQEHGIRARGRRRFRVATTGLAQGTR